MAQAVTWIRDGVLVDRMHVNPVAFAVAYWRYTSPTDRVSLGLEQLINFGFSQSGLSCSEKIELFSLECGHAPDSLPMDVASAVAFYNELATRMARSCSYFDGAVDLLKNLHERGVHNFITSAVEQQVMDIWAEVGAGTEIKPYLSEILGKRQDFLKGQAHFEYIERATGGDINFFVADAPAEIGMATALRPAINVMPIGFAHAIEKEKVLDALKLARVLCDEHHDDWLVMPPYDMGEVNEIADNLIYLPDLNQLVESLQDAGAAMVVVGDAKTIMTGLGPLLFDLIGETSK